MPQHTAVFKDIFPQAAALFSAAEDNSRRRCDSILAYMKVSEPEKSAAVHIAAESGSYEAVDFMLQFFAKFPQTHVKILDATRDIAQHDPALSHVIDRYQNAIHNETMKLIDTAHTLTQAARKP